MSLAYWQKWPEVGSVTYRFYTQINVGYNCRKPIINERFTETTSHWYSTEMLDMGLTFFLFNLLDIFSQSVWYKISQDTFRHSVWDLCFSVCRIALHRRLVAE